ncbi:MAG: hypothetical protein U0800_06690 [Isosphaeraceae bacterium]
MPGSARWGEAEPAPELGPWIWHEARADRSAPVARRWFRLIFSLPDDAKSQRAILKMTADDRFTAYLNGEPVAEGAGWNRPVVADAKARIRPGKNVLAVLAENSPAPVQANPAGLSGALAVLLEDGRALRFETDGSWKSSGREQEGWSGPEFDDGGWPMASVIGPYPSPPWGRIKPAPEIAPAVLAHEDGTRLLYMVDPRPVRIDGLKPSQAYRGTGFDPIRGEARTPFEATADAQGRIALNPPDAGPDRDWAVLLEPIDPPR